MQANEQSGKTFKIITLPFLKNKNNINFKKKLDLIQSYLMNILSNIFQKKIEYKLYSTQ